MIINPAEISRVIKTEIASYTRKADFSEAGTVIQVGDGIARIYGLYHAMSGELLEFANGTYGMALNLDEDTIGAVIMGSDAGIKEGDPVKLTGRMAEVPVGDGLLGRVVNALGEPIDDKGPIAADGFRRIESPAPSVIMRRSVHRPLQTGIKAIDALVPIGRGQRELIIGDRQTGKTALAIDTIINQKDQDVYCVYVAIGQKASTMARIIKILNETGAMDYTTVVLATASDSAPLQYMAPYAGCAIAEEWMYRGKDVLVVYDDLSKHAVAYRAISLLLRRPPGREAYPGDVFYLHSRLLERAACLSQEYGGGTMTALPIVETQAGDISAYIPTNIISITDGQIYLEADLFNHGVRPAINPGFSVSRVGGAAQIPAMKNLAGPLRIEFAQYKELAMFSQFGSDLSEDTLERLRHGERIMEVLKQPQYKPMPVEDQVLILYALNNRHLEDIDVGRIQKFQKDFIKYVDAHAPHIKATIKETGQLPEELAQEIDGVIAEVKKEYSYS
jgi:F-type H+-transporting ATPase subunit alpha